MRRLPALVAFASLLAGTAFAAPTPRTAVLIVASVGENAQEIMPPALWRKIVVDYVGGRPVRIEDGTQLPEEAACRGAQAAYAVFARFDRAMRLPGLAQEIDRMYAVARFTVRNCATGAVSATKMIRLESDPVPPATPTDREVSAERVWQRPIRTAFAHEPLNLAGPAVAKLSTAAPPAAPSTEPSPVPALVAAVSAVPAAFHARVVRIDGELVVLDSGRSMSVNQVLHVVADARGNRYANPIELVVVDISGKYAQAAVQGKAMPRIGDYVEPVQ